MAIFRPFRGIRPAQGKASCIAALPYDVYDTKEAREEVLREPLSFLNIDRAEVQFDPPLSPDDPKVYGRARDTLWEMVEKGDFIREQTPCFYVYELTMEGRVQTGLAGCASIDDYLQNVVRKHENTRAEKEQDRICHVNACQAQTGPIFLTYRAKEDISSVIAQIKEEEPLYDFVSPDGIRHRMFLIPGDEYIKVIEKSFLEIEEVYIADGHHRAASAVKAGLLKREQNPGYTGEEEFNYFLSVCFPDDQLMILDYNRVVKDLNGLEKDEFLRKVKEVFQIKENEGADRHPGNKGEFSMYLDGVWYTCTFSEEKRSSDPVLGLDVSILQEMLLGPVLGISDPRTDGRIGFVGGIRGMEELKRRADETRGVAFALYPTSIKELFAVADEGRLMPPKSTWFEPKLRSGLLIHEI